MRRFSKVIVTIATALIATLYGCNSSSGVIYQNKADQEYYDTTKSVAVLADTYCANAYLESKTKVCTNKLKLVMETVMVQIPNALPPAGPDYVLPKSKARIQDDYMKGLDEIAELSVRSCPMVGGTIDQAKECLDKLKYAIGGSHDPHSEYLDARGVKDLQVATRGKFGGLGIEIGRPTPASPILVTNIIPGTPAERAGLRTGDLIVAIVTSGPGAKTTLTASLKDSGEAVELMRGVPGTAVTLLIKRKDVLAELSFTLVREEIRPVNVKSALIMGNGKHYVTIHIKGFVEKTSEQVKSAFIARKKEAEDAGHTLSGLVLSLESNPGGLLPEACRVSRLFVDTRESIILMHGNNPVDEVVECAKARMTMFGVVPASFEDITGGLPMLVVVNNRSASASEIVAKVLQHENRAPIAGTLDKDGIAKTYGKGIVQTIIPLDATTALKVTTAEYRIGTKNNYEHVQCKGVIADIAFAYPGIDLSKSEVPTECGVPNHVSTAGPMPNAPVRVSIKVSHPDRFAAGEAMLPAYIAARLAEVQVEKARGAILEEVAKPYIDAFKKQEEEKQK